MFSFYFFIKYTFFGGLLRLLQSPASSVRLQHYNVAYIKNLFDGYNIVGHYTTRGAVDTNYKKFFDGVDTFWLDCNGVANDFSYTSQNYVSELHNMSLRDLIMYYVDVKTVDYNDRSERHLMNAISGTIYSWLCAANLSDRKRLLKFLEEEGFSLTTGFDSILHMDRSMGEAGFGIY